MLERSACWISTRARNSVVCSHGSTREEVESLQRHASLCCFSGRYPLMQGKIRYFPILDKERNELNWKEIKLIYIKLALDTPLFQGWDTLDEITKDDVRKILAEPADDYAATIKRRVRYPIRAHLRLPSIFDDVQERHAKTVRSLRRSWCHNDQNKCRRDAPKHNVFEFRTG